MILVASGILIILALLLSTCMYEGQNSQMEVCVIYECMSACIYADNASYSSVGQVRILVNV